MIVTDEGDQRTNYLSRGKKFGGPEGEIFCKFPVDLVVHGGRPMLQGGIGHTPKSANSSIAAAGDKLERVC